MVALGLEDNLEAMEHRDIVGVSYPGDVGVHT